MPNNQLLSTLRDNENPKSRFVPAHETIYNSLPSWMRDVFYMHYMWSNVSCIRIKRGKFTEAQIALSDSVGAVLSDWQKEAHFRALVKQAVSESGFDVNFDTKRENDGYAGLYAYLGTPNAMEFTKRKGSNNAKQGFTHSPLASLRYPREGLGVLQENLDAINAKIVSAPSVDNVGNDESGE